MREQPVVTVTLLAAMPKMAKWSEPYTFTVTANFVDGLGITQNEAFAILHINYVRSCADS